VASDMRSYIVHAVFFFLSTVESLMNFIASVVHIYPRFDFAMNFFERFHLSPSKNKEKALARITEDLKNGISPIIRQTSQE
jgi:hypothetical protein